MGSPESMGEAEIRRDPVPGAPSEAAVKAALWQLIEVGLVELFQGQDSNGTFVPVPPAHRRTTFDNPKSWRVAEDPTTDVRYPTTASGDDQARNLP